MSVTKSNPTATKKTSRAKAVAVAVPAANQVLVSLLENTEIRYASYDSLFIGSLNVRIIPHTPEEVQGYADSIEAVGLLHNLVVVACDDGRLEVVCGGGRTKGIGALVEAGKVDPAEKWIPYKAVPREQARAASLTENGRHKKMHPAEQVIGFRSMSEDGLTPAQIGDLLGYGAPHVQRMLRLASLAPEIIDALAKDELTTEHCHTLALDADQDRQREVLAAAIKEGWNGKPSVQTIKTLMTSGEVSTHNNAKFSFVGGEAAFDDADIRRDLFSDVQGGFVSSVKLNTLCTAKLEQMAVSLCADEGWTWHDVRSERLYRYGDDQQNYVIEAERDPVMTEDEAARMDELAAIMESTDEDSDEHQRAKASRDALEHGGIKRAWADGDKTGRGVVVSWHSGEVCIQRGIIKKSDAQKADEAAVSEAEKQAKLKPVDTVSAPLLKKMSSERTLAVQAALMQQPAKAVALLTWRLCASVFTYCLTTRHPFVISPRVSHSLTSDAPSGETGAAYCALIEEENRLKALLPKGWEKDFTTFFTLDTETLMALQVYCTTRTIDGVQNRVDKHTPVSDLDGVEDAIGFHMRDWWQPTAENFFRHLNTAQIIATLNDAGETGAAGDAAKMKKADAADLAQFRFATTRWMPEWMQSPEAVKRAKAAIPTVVNLDTYRDDVASSANPSPAAAA
jgi:ParB family chromosome partitioning protein